MKLRESTGVVDKSGEFKVSSFKINASAKAFEILSKNIYTDGVSAIIRELSCNAFDSHVAAKQQRPFDVNLPTELDPTFYVRDYGIGLNDDQVREIFSTYFMSTKTNSNDFVGALGLGSKSPFYLVDSFSVSCYDGENARHYNCFLDENREPQIALLGESGDNSDRGVKVSLSVPKNRISEFQEKASEIFKHFSEMPSINLNSVVAEIERNHVTMEKNLIISGDGFKVYSGHQSDSVALMGNVAYAIPRVSEFTGLNHCFQLTFAIGELSFNPGRESLTMDDPTKLAIKNKFATIESCYDKMLVELVENEPTPFKKHMMAMRLKGKTRYSHSSTIENLVKQYRLRPTGNVEVFSKGWNNRVSTNTIDYLPELPECGNYWVVDGPMKFSVRAKELARKNGKVVLIQKQDESLIDPEFLKPVSDLPKIVRQQRGSSTNRKKASGVWKFYGFFLEFTDAIPAGEKLFIPIHGGCSEDIAYNNGALKKAKQLLERIGRTDVEIFGLNREYRNSKAFKNGQWKEFVPFFEETVKNLGLVHTEISSDSYSTSCLHRVLELRPNDKGLSDVMFKIENNYKTNELIDLVPRYLSKDFPVNTIDLGEIARKIKKNCPAMAIVLDWWGLDGKEDSFNFIKGEVEKCQVDSLTS